MNHEIESLVAGIAECLINSGSTLTTVESCTGGGIAYSLTSLPGSSDWFRRAFVTYANEAKTEMVGVPEALLSQYGAVSLEVAESMAEGGMRAASSDYAISVTGIAGPSGGSDEKPVGTVCFGWAAKGHATQTERIVFAGDRNQVRLESIRYALAGWLQRFGVDNLA